MTSKINWNISFHTSP